MPATDAGETSGTKTSRPWPYSPKKPNNCQVVKYFFHTHQQDSCEGRLDPKYLKEQGKVVECVPCTQSCGDRWLAVAESESRMRWNNAGSHVLITAMSRRVEDMENTMGSTPLLAANADSRTSVSPHHPYDEYWQEILTRRITLALLVIYSIIFALGIVGNGLVILVLGFYMKKTVSTIWFLNLAVANFLFTCSLPLRIAHNALKLHWPFGKALCKLNDSIAYLNLYASAYFLAALSIHHWASVRSSVWAQNLRRKRFAWFVASGVWFLALVFSSPRIHFRNTRPSPIDEEVIICFLSYSKSFKPARINHHIILISQYIFAFLVPISVTMACHVKIALERRQGALRTKSFKVITEATMIFYLCWLPYHVFSFFEGQFSERSVLLTIGIPLTTGLAFVSSCANPILYLVIGYDFRARQRFSILAAFENVFGEESSGSAPETQARPATETNPPDL